MKGPSSHALQCRGTHPLSKVDAIRAHAKRVNADRLHNRESLPWLGSSVPKPPRYIDNDGAGVCPFAVSRRVPKLFFAPM
jgi:hypothetical protein